MDIAEIVPSEEWLKEAAHRVAEALECGLAEHGSDTVIGDKERDIILIALRGED